MIWVCLYNIVCVTVLAYLSLTFDKWWIVLFAAIMTMSYREGPKKDNDEEEIEKDDEDQAEGSC